MVHHLFGQDLEKTLLAELCLLLHHVLKAIYNHQKTKQNKNKTKNKLNIKKEIRDANFILKEITNPLFTNIEWK